jgi:hypothetical protein
MFLGSFINFFPLVSSSRMADEQKKKGVTVRDVEPAKFISAYADVLKNNDKFIVPKWVDLVKTGVGKELAPYDPDWYHIRAGNIYCCYLCFHVVIFFMVSFVAAIIRKIYLRPGSGVGSLSKKFGNGCRYFLFPIVRNRLYHVFLSVDVDLVLENTWMLRPDLSDQFYSP